MIVITKTTSFNKKRGTGQELGIRSESPKAQNLPPQKTPQIDADVRTAPSI